MTGELRNLGINPSRLLMCQVLVPRRHLRGVLTCVDRSPESVAMSKALKKAGFRFVGPTTCYSLMQVRCHSACPMLLGTRQKGLLSALKTDGTLTAHDTWSGIDGSRSRGIIPLLAIMFVQIS
jgi:hypothetical protein